MHKKYPQIIAVVLGLLIVVGVGYAWANRLSERKGVSEGVAELVADSDNQPDYSNKRIVDTQDWKVYKNERYGVVFSYPAWIAEDIEKCESSKLGLLCIIRRGATGLVVRVATKKEAQLYSQYIQELESENELVVSTRTPYGEWIDDFARFHKEISIDNYPFKFISDFYYHSSGELIQKHVTYRNGTRYELEFQMWTESNLDIPQSEYGGIDQKFFDQYVESLRVKNKSTEFTRTFDMFKEVLGQFRLTI